MQVEIILFMLFFNSIDLCPKTRLRAMPNAGALLRVVTKLHGPHRQGVCRWACRLFVYRMNCYTGTNYCRRVSEMANRKSFPNPWVLKGTLNAWKRSALMALCIKTALRWRLAAAHHLCFHGDCMSIPANMPTQSLCHVKRRTAHDI